MSYLNKKIFLLLLLFLSAFFSFSCKSNNNKPVAVKGLIDLSSWNFNKDGIVELNGQWEFYWNKTFYPSDFDSSKKDNMHYFKLPSQWNGIKNAELKDLPPLGKATYRLKIKMPENLQGHKIILALKLQDIHSSYKIWLNGRLFLEKGSYSDLPEKCRPALGREIVSFDANTNYLDIVINAANYYDTNEAGIDEEIFLGTEKDIFLESMQKNFLYLISFGVFLIMSLYHFLLFIIRRNDKEYLYFSITCFLLAIQTICEGDKFVFYILPNLSTDLYLKIWLASVSVIAVLLRFYYIFFPQEINKKVMNFVSVVFLLQVLSLAVLPTKYYMPLQYPVFYFGLLVLMYMLYGLFLAVLQKRKHALLVFLGTLFPLLAGINDLLYAVAIIYTGYFGCVGFIVLVFSQAYFLSLRYNDSYRKIENLSQELETANRFLDHKVEERTLALKEANTELSKTIAIKNKFFSIIAHDMKNLFQAMLGYSDLIILKTGEDKQQDINEDATVIKDTTKKAYNLMENLLEWSLAETGGITLKKEKLKLKDVIKESVELLDAYCRSKRVYLSLDIDGDLSLIADKRMMNTIFRNLISNAVKYSFKESAVKISAVKNNNYIIVSVSDCGKGIEKEKLNNLFRPESVESTPGTDKEKGTGLGLLLVNEFVQRNNGTISVESEVNKGTTFNLSFPL
ncbi:MAG: sensor histidine kinase [Bacteroidota bacterium]|nr:sensor histidine kinase [Bacteroidota bacterium]